MESNEAGNEGMGPMTRVPLLTAILRVPLAPDELLRIKAAAADAGISAAGFVRVAARQALATLDLEPAESEAGE